MPDVLAKADGSPMYTHLEPGLERTVYAHFQDGWSGTTEAPATFVEKTDEAITCVIGGRIVYEKDISVDAIAAELRRGVATWRAHRKVAADLKKW